MGLRPLAVTIGVALALLGVTTLQVGLRATRAVDLAVTMALQSVASAPLDVLANADTLIGQFSVTAAIATLIAYLIRRRGPPLAWFAAGLFVVVSAVELALKLTLVHPPPPPELVRAFWDPLGVSVPTPSGFPSGHVARVTFLAILAAAVVHVTAARVGLAMLVALTLWARVYIGDHWLSDAVGGLALGVAAGCLAIGWIGWCRAYARRA